MYSLGGVTAEDANDNGIGNLTMTLLTRGTASRSAEQIAEQLDASGATLDAGCGNNSWFWTGSCLSGDFDSFLGLYADVVRNPKFVPAEVAAMKQRVDADIAGEDASWDAQSLRFFKQSFYGPTDSPYQFMPVGTQATVDKLTPEELQHWYARKVLGGRRVLAIYGDVDPDHAEAVARRLLGQSPTTRNDGVERPPRRYDRTDLPHDASGGQAVRHRDGREGAENRAGVGRRGDRFQERQRDR